MSDPTHKTQMSVSAALRRIKKIKGAIADRTARAQAGALYIEQKEPAFRFDASMEERSTLCTEMVKLQTLVAISNARTSVGGGKTVAQAIRELDEMKSLIAFYKSMPVRPKARDLDVEESVDWDETMEKRVKKVKETVWISAIDQAERAARVERLMEKFEALNGEVESSNHRTMIDG